MKLPPKDSLSHGLLLRYFTEWQAWVDAGAADFEPFCRSWGLCGNANVFCGTGMERDDLHDALGALFSANGLDPLYPFGGEANFDRMMIHGTMHTCPIRLDFVREALKGLNE